MQRDFLDTAARLRGLEHSVRRNRLVSTLCAMGLAVTWLAAAASPPQRDQQIVRARILIVEDEHGRDRIVLGAPMPDGRRVTGMKILNEDGAEQFGLTLKVDGSVSMGFDVKPGVGNPGNRERLNMGVTPGGQGWIRYLDNETRARLWLRLNAHDSPVLQFLAWREGEPRIMVRQLGLTDERLEWPR